MNSHQYFCNLYQAYLMATNSLRISHITLERFGGNTLYNTPERQQLSLIFNELPKIRSIRITTNYKRSYPYRHQDKYYHASEIEALSYSEEFKSPFFSFVKERVDKKTFEYSLSITRRVLL